MVTEEEAMAVATRLRTTPASILISPVRIANVERLLCSACAKRVDAFRNKLSKEEYMISGMCQDCQDKVFR